MFPPHGAGGAMPWGAGEGYRPSSPGFAEPVSLREWPLVPGHDAGEECHGAYGGRGGFSESLEGQLGWCLLLGKSEYIMEG